MPDKLTDEQIKRALECCAKGNMDDACPECPLVDYDGCMEHLVVYLAELINRLQAENERLESLNNRLGDDVDLKIKYIYELEERLKTVKAEAYKEFAERIKLEFYYEFDELIPSIMADKIDNIVNELIGE